jgi:hypothetical protein
VTESRDELVELGVLDPDAPDTEERLVLIRLAVTTARRSTRSA